MYKENKLTFSDEWLIGFIEGEGSFNIGITKCYKRKTKRTCEFMGEYMYGVYPFFCLALNKKDKETLEKIVEKLGMGNLRYKSCKLARINGVRTEPQWRYEIYSIANCLKLIEFLDGFKFYTFKRKQYENWKRMVYLIRDKQHLTKKGFFEIVKLRNEYGRKYHTGKNFS